MDLGLSGRRILITGASAGIGRATALLLAAEGARLVLGARRASTLEETAEEARTRGAQATCLAGDLVEEGVLEALTALARESYGGIDGLVCCVGSTPLGDFGSLDDSTWQTAFDTKFMGAVRAIRSTIPDLRRADRARVVIIGGNSTYNPTPVMTTSSVMNSALGALASVLARTFASEGVGFVCVDPGPTKTARLDGLTAALSRTTGLDKSETEATLLAQIPSGRFTTPEEVANVVAMSLSPLQSQVTGTRLVIDGASTWVR